MRIFLSTLASRDDRGFLVPHAPEELEGKLEEWSNAFASLQDYIFVALCDPICAELAANTLKILIAHTSLGNSILKNKRLVGLIFFFNFNYSTNPLTFSHHILNSFFSKRKNMITVAQYGSYL